jgi:hypothetical protein
MEKTATAHIKRPQGSHELEPGRAGAARLAADDDVGSSPGDADVALDGDWTMTNCPSAGQIFLMIFRSAWPA